MANPRLQRGQALWDIELVLEPRHLRSILDAAGNRPPGALPNKGNYIFKHDLASERDSPFSL